MIREKMLKLYSHFAEKKLEKSQAVPFQASKGWLEKFKIRASLHNLKTSGETASADHVAAQSYPETLKRLI